MFRGIFTLRTPASTGRRIGSPPVRLDLPNRLISANNILSYTMAYHLSDAVTEIPAKFIEISVTLTETSVKLTATSVKFKEIAVKVTEISGRL